MRDNFHRFMPNSYIYFFVKSVQCYCLLTATRIKTKLRLEKKIRFDVLTSWYYGFTTMLRSIVIPYWNNLCLCQRIWKCFYTWSTFGSSPSSRVTNRHIYGYEPILYSRYFSQIMSILLCKGQNQLSWKWRFLRHYFDSVTNLNVFQL